MLVRTALYLFLAQVLATDVIAAAVPGGAAWLTLAGFVTPYYDSNVFAVKLAPLPWTDPVVYLSAQTLIQMTALAAAGSALITLARATPWRPGALPDSAPPARDKDTAGGQGRAVPSDPSAAAGPAPKPPAQ